MSTSPASQPPEPRVITSISNNSTAVKESVGTEEQRQLAEADRSYLLDDSLRLDGAPQPRTIGETALPRTIVVLFGVGIFAFLGLAIVFALGLAGGEKDALDVPKAPEPTPIQPDQSDELKTQLALLDQQKDIAGIAPKEIKTPPPSPSPAPKAEPKSVRRTASSPRYDSPPPRTRTVTRTVERPRSAPASAKAAPEIDPYRLWDQLAGVGTMSGTVPVEEPTKPAAIADKTEPAKPTLIASAQLGGDQEGVSPGEMGIVQQRAIPIEAAEQKTVLLGTSTPATMAVPMIWTAETSTLTRAAVELTEPLVDANGEPALPAGTVLITEVTAVHDQIVEQTAIAVLYPRNGELVQEAIEPGVLVIRGEDNEPLIAETVEQGDSVDFLSAFTRAVAGIGSRLAEPEFARTIIAGDTEISSSQQDTGASVAGGALEGFFGTVADQLQQNAQNRRQTAQTSALIVEAGTTVEVLVNGFLEIAP